MNPPRIQLAALIAGGKSRRMGQDKAMLDWEGQPLWRHQWETLAGLKPERMAVVAPEPPSWISDLGWIKDHEDIGLIRPIGPIGGLLAALESAEKGLVAALAVDLPAITPQYLLQLQAHCTASTGAVPHIAGNGFEPLVAIYPASAADSAREWIGNGRYDFQGWIARLVAEGLLRNVEVDSQEERFFRNLNTPEDLERVKIQLANPPRLLHTEETTQ